MLFRSDLIVVVVLVSDLKLGGPLMKIEIHSDWSVEILQNSRLSSPHPATQRRQRNTHHTPQHHVWAVPPYQSTLRWSSMVIDTLYRSLPYLMSPLTGRCHGDSPDIRNIAIVNGYERSTTSSRRLIPRSHAWDRQ